MNTTSSKLNYNCINFTENENFNENFRIPKSLGIKSRVKIKKETTKILPRRIFYPVNEIKGNYDFNQNYLEFSTTHTTPMTRLAEKPIEEKHNNPMTLEEKFHHLKENNVLCKLIFDKDISQIKNVLQDFDYRDDLRLKLLNSKDFRGNTLIILCILLRSVDKCQEFLHTLQILIENGADAKIKNLEKWSPIEIATSYQDYEAVSILFKSLLTRRKIKINKNSKRLKSFLSDMPDFYLEMCWEVNIPVISFLCPSDTCRIWKYKSDVRMEYTFVQFKNLQTVRNPSCFLFKSDDKREDTKRSLTVDEGNFYHIDLKKKTFYNPFEEFEDDEKALIIQDIMNAKRMDGEFKLRNCAITESKTYWRNNPIYEIVNGWKAQKYEIQISTFVNIHQKEKFVFSNLTKDAYLNKDTSLDIQKEIVMNETELKNHIANGLKVKNDSLRSEILKIQNNKEKTFKAYVWIAENFPIKSSHFVTLMDSVSSANELTQKIKEFLNNPQVKGIIDKNGFPIKIQIPFNFLIDFTVTFIKHKKLSTEIDPYLDYKFNLFPEWTKISRKEAQNLATNQKKRMGYANIRG